MVKRCLHLSAGCTGVETVLELVIHSQELVVLLLVESQKYQVDDELDEVVSQYVDEVLLSGVVSLGLMVDEESHGCHVESFEVNEVVSKYEGVADEGVSLLSVLEEESQGFQVDSFVEEMDDVELCDSVGGVFVLSGVGVDDTSATVSLFACSCNRGKDVANPRIRQKTIIS